MEGLEQTRNIDVLNEKMGEFTDTLTVSAESETAANVFSFSTKCIQNRIPNKFGLVLTDHNGCRMSAAAVVVMRR